MPWLETSPVEQREHFIADDRLGLYTRAELCTRYAISRKTGYKWLARYHEEGRRGLTDRRHASHLCPHRIAPAIAICCAGRGGSLSPQENGAHERLHKTFKAGACRPPRATLAAHQRAFHRFRTRYNEERPHASLGGQTPSSR